MKKKLIAQETGAPEAAVATAETQTEQKASRAPRRAPVSTAIYSTATGPAATTGYSA
jgi:hypothetical protein